MNFYVSLCWPKGKFLRFFRRCKSRDSLKLQESAGIVTISSWNVVLGKYIIRIHKPWLVCAIKNVLREVHANFIKLKFCVCRNNTHSWLTLMCVNNCMYMFYSWYFMYVPCCQASEHSFAFLMLSLISIDLWPIKCLNKVISLICFMWKLSDFMAFCCSSLRFHLLEMLKTVNYI